MMVSSWPKFNTETGTLTTLDVLGRYAMSRIYHKLGDVRAEIRSSSLFYSALSSVAKKNETI